MKSSEVQRKILVMVSNGATPLAMKVLQNEFKRIPKNNKKVK